MTIVLIVMTIVLIVMTIVLIVMTIVLVDMTIANGINMPLRPCFKSFYSDS
jgi:hypothetical protein